MASRMDDTAIFGRLVEKFSAKSSEVDMENYGNEILQTLMDLEVC